MPGGGGTKSTVPEGTRIQAARRDRTESSYAEEWKLSPRSQDAGR